MNCPNHQVCQQHALTLAEQICRKNNWRLTTIRKTILRAVWNSHRCVTARELIASLAGDDIHLAAMTVYRALDFLVARGFIHKLERYNAYVGCTHPADRCHCCLLICQKCLNARECCNQLLDQALGGTAGSYTFKLQTTCIEIDGICADCSHSTPAS